MSRINIPLDVLTSRLNIQDRFSSFQNTSLSSRFSNMRPIGEFLDFKRLSKPADFNEVQSRVSYNIGTFSSNYFAVFLLLSIYALVTNPLLLFDIILLAGGLFVLGRMGGQDLHIGTFHATSSQLYTGLFCTCGLLFLIASPFSTVLWLIGASGFFRGGGLDGRPRAPEFAPQWGRPSRRGGDWAAPAGGGDSFWGLAARSVEELNTDDSDAHGAALARTGNRRYISDPLQFTGIDLGAGGSSRPRIGYGHSDDATEDDSSEEDTEEDEDEEEDDEPPLTPEEEALVQGALKKLRKAQSKGKTDVKLNKEQLAALDRRRKVMQAEATKEARHKTKKQVSVPLSYFTGASASTSSLSRSSQPAALPPSQAPPKGRFAPPATARRSSTSPRDTSPFEYQYVNRPSSNHRHASDPSANPVSSYETGRQLRSTADPFRYQTAGTPVDMDLAYGQLPSRRGAPGASRSDPRLARTGETSSEEEEEESSSDGNRNGMPVTRSARAALPPSKPEPPKKKASTSSQDAAKKKTTAGPTTRRRKGK